MKPKALKKITLSAALATALVVPVTGMAASLTANLDVSIVIGGTCTAVSNASLYFGNHTSLPVAHTDHQTSFTVECGAGVPFQIGLNDGQNATGTQRRMANGPSDFVSYDLYKDAGRTQDWRDGYNTTGTLSLTGTGAAQTVNVYGRVPGGQVTPIAGVYTDKVAITVYY